MSQHLGQVSAIHIAGKGGEPLQPVSRAQAIAGHGLAGDRYATKTGTFSPKPGNGRDVTLIEAEAIEAVVADYQVTVTAAETRRNIVTRGVALNHLVGKEFSIGEVRLRGCRLCEPCGYLAKLTSQKISDAFIHRGGLRCDILTPGTIQVGDVMTGV